MLYQIIVVLVGIISILLVFRSFTNKSLSMSSLILWVILWIFLIIFAIFPDSSNFLALVFGISRGLDLLLIFALIGTYYLLFRLFFKLDKINQNITNIVRFIAIENEKKSNDIIGCDEIKDDNIDNEN